MVSTSEPSTAAHAPVGGKASREAALFDGIFLAGFECSTHRLEDGRRLDLHASTEHDRCASEDYDLARRAGMSACRDGVSWVASEPAPGQFDFSRAMRLLQAADAASITVIWDLMHFGWPDDVDPFSASFPTRFARYAAAFARRLADHGATAPFITPINEISFLAWGGGDIGCMNPFATARGVELKFQLVRATIEAIESIRAILPQSRFLQPEPIICIHPAPEHPKTWRRVATDNELQFQAWDMLTGAVWPSLGGHPRYLDVIGVNFYPDNQFMLDGTTIERGDHRYRPLSAMMAEVWRRYDKPLMISETGAEGGGRADWLRYVCDEVVHVMANGCPVHGITLYPAISHLGWNDGRECQNGLWGPADACGRRAAHAPLALEMSRQEARLRAERDRALGARTLLPSVS